MSVEKETKGNGEGKEEIEKEKEIVWDDFSEQKLNRDLILQVDETLFWVSRKELADASPVFKSMLYGDFQEAKQDQVQLPGKEAKEVLEVLRCLFPTGDQTSKEPDEENLEILLKFGDEYEIEYLTKKCSLFLTKMVKEKDGFKKRETGVFVEEGTLFCTTPAKLNGAVENEKEIMKFFQLGIRYKLKEFVRTVLHIFLRLDSAKLMRYGDDLPLELRFAILLPLTSQIFEHEFQKIGDYTPHPCDKCKDVKTRGASGQFCIFCRSMFCDDCYKARKYDRRCDIGHCRTCKEEFGEKGIFCECVDPLAIAELEKIGL